MVGRTVLQYQFLEKLGSGGMGEIFKAQDTKLNRFVAVKILPSDKSGDPERRRRFIQEAQAASALNHPNIITIHDIISEGDTQYMVMEFVSGKTLLDLIPTGGMRVPQVLQYATQMADALTVAHAHGIIHRDFKPANVMVTTSGLIKVLDFGLAKLAERGPASQFDPDATSSQAPITVEGSIMGTVSYMSPEQAEGKRVDARSDIFSFGSVLYEMVTGRRAFHGDSGISTLTSVLRDDIRPIADVAPDVPPLLEVIIARCLNKDPDGRWQAMKEVGDALSSLRRTLDSGVFDRPTAVVPPPVPVIPPATPPSNQPANPPATPPGTPTVTPGAPQGPRTTPAMWTPGTKPGAAGPAVAGTPGTTPGPGKKTSPLIPILALLGLLAVGGAGAVGWLWYTHHWPFQPPAPPVVTVIPPVTTAGTDTPPPPPPPVVETPPSAPVTNTGAAATSNTKPKTTAPPTITTTKTTNPVPSVAPPAVVNQDKATQKKTTPPTPVQHKEAPLPPPVPVAIGDALPFRITLDEDVPADAQNGQELRFTVVDGLQVDGVVVIAKGAKVTGSITGEVGKKVLGIGSKKLNFRLLQTEGVDGTKLNVRATAGHGNKGPATRPFDTGKNSKSKELIAAKGTEYYGYTDGAQTVSVRK